MRLVRLIPNKNIFLFAIFSIIFIVNAGAQENSPFSRYGLGDIFPNESVQYKGIGGMTSSQGAPLILNQPNLGVLALNPNNPASYGFFKTDSGGNGGAVNYDLGIMGDLRTLKSTNPSKSYNSANLTPAYFTIGVPLHRSGFGLAFGIKPVTRVSYNIQHALGFANSPYTQKIDSFVTRNEGQGGINQFFLGLGKSIKNFRVGVNAAYNFGKRDFSTITSIANDSFYYVNFMKENKIVYKGITWDAGMQYSLKLKEISDDVSKMRSTYNLDLGINGSIAQKLNATQEEGYYSVSYTTADEERVNPNITDTISLVQGKKGKITLPLKVSGGFMLHKYINYVQKYGFGAEYSMAQWENYKGLNSVADTALTNSFMIRAGGYFIPDPLRGQNIFSTARYSIGGYYGKDYINVGNDSKGYDIMAITVGIGFILRNQNYGYRMPSSMINTSFEFGKRGNNNNNISENFYKISVGLSLRDIWLVKRKYD